MSTNITSMSPVFSHIKAEREVATYLDMNGYSILKSGWPDFLCVSDQHTFCVEVKDGLDKLSACQRHVALALNSAGLPTFVVRPENYRLVLDGVIQRQGPVRIDVPTIGRGSVSPAVLSLMKELRMMRNRVSELGINFRSIEAEAARPYELDAEQDQALRDLNADLDRASNGNNRCPAKRAIVGPSNSPNKQCTDPIRVGFRLCGRHLKLAEKLGCGLEMFREREPLTATIAPALSA